MGQTSIDRVREDLETIREAAGLGLPFGWEDVWMNLALVPCGGIIFALGAFGPLRYVRLSLIPAVLLFMAAAGLRVRFRRSTGRSPIRRREYTLGLVAGLLYAGITGGCLAWARSLGEPTRMTGAIAVALAGGLCAVLALTSPGRRSLFAAALALLAFGLVIPVCSPRQVIVAAGVTMAIAGLAGAAIQALQLHNERAGYEPATH